MKKLIKKIEIFIFNPKNDHLVAKILMVILTLFVCLLFGILGQNGFFNEPLF
jgi:hypothetical protein